MKHKRKLKQTCRVLHRNPKILKHNAWKLLFSPSSPQLFQNIGEFGAKQYFKEHRIGNTVQLLVAIKGNFPNLIFL